MAYLYRSSFLGNRIYTGNSSHHLEVYKPRHFGTDSLVHKHLRVNKTVKGKNYSFSCTWSSSLYSWETDQVNLDHETTPNCDVFFMNTWKKSIDLAVHHILFHFTSVTTHTVCWENTRKVLTNFLSVVAAHFASPWKKLNRLDFSNELSFCTYYVLYRHKIVNNTPAASPACTRNGFHSSWRRCRHSIDNSCRSSGSRSSS